jgi:Domain of unknown function (DUF4331)
VSDHISGPRALAEPLADITDFYVFPSPTGASRLVLIQNTYPFAQPGTRFSDGLIYRFRLHPIDFDMARSGNRFVVANDEFTIDCAFSSPANTRTAKSDQTGTCVASSGMSVPIAVNEVGGDPENRLRVFAGARWDPFFMDAPAALKTIASRQLAFTDPGQIYLDGKSILSLVVEVDLAVLGCKSPLVAVITETLTSGKIPVRLERVGRPEVKNMMLAPKQFDPVNRDLEIRDLYNMEDAFHLADAYKGAYRARLDANLVFWDGLDGKIDWKTDASGSHPLTDCILADYLIVDVSKPYQETGTFFEIERSVLNGRRHESCGGRAPNDDVMDTIFSLMVNAGRGPIVRDGVDRATRPATQAFPYLASPSPAPPQPPEHH